MHANKDENHISMAEIQSITIIETSLKVVSSTW